MAEDFCQRIERWDEPRTSSGEIGGERVRHNNIWCLDFKRQKDKIDKLTLIDLSVNLPILEAMVAGENGDNFYKE